MVAKAWREDSVIDATSVCTVPFSNTANELCTYWDTLQLVEAATQQRLLAEMRNGLTSA